MSRGEPIFANRKQAGRELAAALPKGIKDAVIFALPRGGVPVAFELARFLRAPLDVLLVRKIGAPGQEELALGAIVDGDDPALVLNEEIIEKAKIPLWYIEEAAEHKLREIEKRRRLYRRGATPLHSECRTAIVVDDGIATGATVKAALRGMQTRRPRRLMLAVPVAPIDVLDELAKQCDEIVCLATPEPFLSVGTYYDDFWPVADKEVVALLDEARDFAHLPEPAD